MFICLSVVADCGRLSFVLSLDAAATAEHTIRPVDHNGGHGTPRNAVAAAAERDNRGLSIATHGSHDQNQICMGGGWVCVVHLPDVRLDVYVLFII